MVQSKDNKLHFASKKLYKKTLKEKQLQILRLQRELYEQNIPVILIFEGWDAAGKGGTIKRITERLDPRGYSVHGIKAPDEHELHYHYMRRFWKALPKKGHICIFDRSWYGRVLVERVEALATAEEWSRAYDEINHTEKMLVKDGHIIIKFWLDISREEQLFRFKARESDPFKNWKLTNEDWRNREKWDLYEKAIEDVINQTNSAWAKWYFINSNDKRSARIAVLDILIHVFKKRAGEIY